VRNFWKDLNKPFFCLAPMADVTDSAFRKIITKYGKPDVTWTEFVSADGLAYLLKTFPNAITSWSGDFPRGPEQERSETVFKLLLDLKFSKEEHPIVAQIFGGKPENIKIATKLCADLGFDGVDINMGCPDKSIEKQFAGAACIKNPKLAIEIVNAAREGAPNLPISVKTRIGYNGNKMDEEWLTTLLSLNLPVLTIHLRTRKEMSLVPAHWEYMPKIVELRNKISPNTLIIGNGDVLDIDDARRKCEETRCDGVMLASWRPGWRDT
jgi:tRNA-dihydrouridine synthase